MSNSSIFNWRQRTMLTSDELRAGQMMAFDGHKHQRGFQRACFRALQAFRQARPQLAGQPVALFRDLAAVIEGLQAANFELNNTAAETASAKLEMAVRAMIHAQPVKLDVPDNPYERAKLLSVEMDRANILLTIHNAEVQRDRDGNVFTRTVEKCNAAMADEDVNPSLVLDLLDKMHRAAVELLLEKFAADIPEPVDEVTAARENARTLQERAAARQ